MDRVFFPWSASVTLEIDGFNLDLRRRSRSSSSCECATRPLRFTVVQHLYSRFPLLRLIAANYTSRSVIGELFLRNVVIRAGICSFAIIKFSVVTTVRRNAVTTILNVNRNALIFSSNSSCSNIYYHFFAFLNTTLF